MGIVTAAVYGETFSIFSIVQNIANSVPTSISYNYPYDPFATPTTIQSSPSVPNTSGITALLALEIVYSVLVVLASCAGLYGVLKEKGKWVYWFAMSFYAAAVLGLIFGITTVALIVSLENQLCNGLPFCPIPAPVGNIVSMIFAFLFNLYFALCIHSYARILMNPELAATQQTQSTPMQNMNPGQGAYPNPIPVEAQQHYAVDDKQQV